MKNNLIYLAIILLLIPISSAFTITCGDGICHGDEIVISSPIFCMDDCREPCGDGYCNLLYGEERDTGHYCPEDCDNVCGNTLCDENETTENCPEDCNQALREEQQKIDCESIGGQCIHGAHFCPAGYIETFHSCDDYISRRCCVYDESAGTQNCACRDDGQCMAGECRTCSDCYESAEQVQKASEKKTEHKPTLQATQQSWLKRLISSVWDFIFGRYS